MLAPLSRKQQRLLLIPGCRSSLDDMSKYLVEEDIKPAV